MEKNIFESKKNQNVIISAIIIAGFLIACAILLRGSKNPASLNSATKTDGIPVTTATLTPVGPADRTLGNGDAKVTVIMYEDFQCVFCGAVSGSQPENSEAIQYLKQKVDPNWTAFMPVIMDYVKNGSVRFVYRDFPFLGTESVQSAIAARCAEDQGKFWEYHDYLFSHQNGENKGAFSNPNLESFAKILGLQTTDFNQCLEGGKYTQAVADSKTEGINAGVTGTPKGFILKDGKIAATIDGAEPATSVKEKIDAALK
jgi:protein-disulfide isomerase